MANKRFLSLLFLISITNLFWTNAEALTCSSGTFYEEGQRPVLKVITCPEYAKYACFKEVLQISDDEILVRYGCADEWDCKNKRDYNCCSRDNCNKNL
jgi:hypothetical protein